MNFIITYHEHSLKNYEIEYPRNYEEYDGPYLGRVRRVTVTGSDMKEVWGEYMGRLKDEGWKVFDWNSIIKNDVVLHAFHIASADKPNYCYGYGFQNYITDVASNARIENLGE